MSSSSFRKERFTYFSPNTEFQNVNYCELHFYTLTAAREQNSYSPVGSRSPGAMIFSEDKGWFVTSVLKGRGICSWVEGLVGYCLSVNLCWSPRKDVDDHFKDLGTFLGTNKQQGVKGEMSC